MSERGSDGVPSLGRRVLTAAVTGAVLAAWLGVIEAFILERIRSGTTGGQFATDAVVTYAPFGLLCGAAFALVCEAVSPRRAWARRPFYRLALATLIVDFQAAVTYQIHFAPKDMAPFSADELRSAFLSTVPALAIVAAAFWFFTRRSERPARISGALLLGLTALPLIGACALPSLAAFVGADGGPSNRNVLLIVMDTTRRDRLSVYGYERPTTPNLERFASDGLLFERAYSAAPWTLPSHASMFTGRYPSEHQAVNDHTFLDAGLPTLAEHLTQEGYLTFAVAQKAWLNSDIGIMRGFTQFHDLHNRSGTAMGAVWHRITNVISRRRGTADRGARSINDRLIELLGRYGNRPFFAFVNYDESHAARQVPSPFREQFLGDESDSPWAHGKTLNERGFNKGEVAYTDEEIQIQNDLYDGAVAYEDSRIGEVLDFMAKRGLLDRTLVIVTADHGEHLGWTGRFGHNSTLENALIEVPLIVRNPGFVPAGATTDVPVETRLLWKLIDRFIAAGDVSSPEPIDTFVEALRDSGSVDAPILSELYDDENGDAYKSLVLGDMKYVRRQLKNGTLEERLFDVSTDPDEAKDLAAAHPTELAHYRELLRSKVDSLEKRDVEAAPELDEELKARLRQMGYLQ